MAWKHLGWTPVGFSEIEPFPCAVLNHHYPDVTNYGDMNEFKSWKIPDAINLLVGGTPCQSFSVAGLRKGLSDPRGGLMLKYLEIIKHHQPRWFVWENVPGVLSSGRGRDFGTFLGSLGDLGYGWAYRVLDTQWVRTHRFPRALPQRRRRVFVVGCNGDTAGPAKVLFERESLRRDTAPIRGKRETTAAGAEDSAGIGSHWDGKQHPHPTLTQSHSGSGGIGASNQEVFAQRGSGLVDGAICLSSGQEAPILFQAAELRINGKITMRSVCPTITSSTKFGDTEPRVIVPHTKAGWFSGSGPASVRRLTPREFERLQGFPDDYTRIAWRNKPEAECPDSPRYKAIGNSMSVNVMQWIGERIRAADLAPHDSGATVHKHT